MAISNLFMDGVKDMMVDRTDSAFAKFSRVIQEQPENAAAHFQLSRLWLKKNDLPQAFASIQAAYRADPHNKWITQRYAELSALEGRFTEAARLYGILASTESAPEEFLVRQALSLQQAEDYRGSLNVLGKLKQYTGEDDEALLMQRQKLFLSLDEIDSAIAENKLLIRYYPGKPEYLILLGNLYMSDSRMKEGLDVFYEADRNFPGNLLVQETLVQFYLSQKDTAKLKNYLDEILFGRNGNISDKLDLLSLFVHNRDKDALAREITYEFLPRLSARLPAQQEAIIFYGYILDADGSKDSAIVQFRRAIAADSTQYAAWQQLMVIYGEQLQPDSLVRIAARAEEIFPDNPLIYYFKSMGFILKKDYPRALPALQLGLKVTKPVDTGLLTQFHTALGDVFQELESPRAADSNYKRALQLQPDNLTLLNNYSYFLSQQGYRLKEAERMSAKTIRAKPREGTFLDTYGWILFKQGRYKEAKRFLEKALANMTETARGVTYDHLGDVEFRLGNLKAAIEYWKLARDSGVDSDALDFKIKNKRLYE